MTNMNCDGDGSCFMQSDYNSFEKIFECRHKCQLVACPKCGNLGPQWILDTHEHFCAKCALELHTICCKIKLDHVYNKFMDNMADFYKKYRKEGTDNSDDSDTDDSSDDTDDSSDDSDDSNTAN